MLLLAEKEYLSYSKSKALVYLKQLLVHVALSAKLTVFVILSLLCSTQIHTCNIHIVTLVPITRK